MRKEKLRGSEHTCLEASRTSRDLSAGTFHIAYAVYCMTRARVLHIHNAPRNLTPHTLELPEEMQLLFAKGVGTRPPARVPSPAQLMPRDNFVHYAHLAQGLQSVL